MGERKFLKMFAEGRRASKRAARRPMIYKAISEVSESKKLRPVYVPQVEPMQHNTTPEAKPEKLSPILCETESVEPAEPEPLGDTNDNYIQMLEATPAQRKLSQFTDAAKQVTYLEGQIQKWKDEKASWDEKKKELERERDEARKEAFNATKERRDLEEKLKKAGKQAEDAKKATWNALASATETYKICVRNFVASQTNGAIKDEAP